MNNRRTFIKSLGLMGASALVSDSLLGQISSDDVEQAKEKNGKIKISILQTTDVHCQTRSHDELFWENNQITFRKTGGYAKIKTYLTEFKKKNKHVFTLDSGDMFQGSELSVKTTGEAFVPILNELGYDLYLPGNWEVVYGKKSMQHLLGSLHAPKICANMYHDLGDGKRGELIFPPYHIWHVAGIKIGFLGYTDHLVPLRQSPIYSKGIIYTKPEDNLAHYVDVLKNQEKCAYILMVSHCGLSQQIALANNPDAQGIDYILGGDTHERVRKPIQCKYTKVVEPGAFGSFVGKLDLEIENGQVVSDSYELVEIKDSLTDDKSMAKLVDRMEHEFQPSIQEVIGYSTIPLYRYFVIENTIDTLILSALHEKFPEVDIVLSNGFRFCPPKSTPDASGNIPITNGYLFDMLPVDSTARKGNVTGLQLKNWLEKELNNVFAENAHERFGGWVVKFKGMKITFHAFGKMGERVQSIEINGQVLDENKVYSILACEREGDPDDMLCRMRKVQNTKNTPFTLHTVLKDYLKKNSPVTPTPEKNAVALDAPATLLTQVTGVDYQFT